MSDVQAAFLGVGVLGILMIFGLLITRWATLKPIIRFGLIIAFIALIATVGSAVTREAARQGAAAPPASDVMAGLLAFALVAGAIGLYLLPVSIAQRRHHPNIGPIAIINIFLGWTVLGWIIAMAWSVSAVAGRSQER